MPRTIAIFDCEDAPKWKDFTYTGWKALLEQPCDVWLEFKCHAGCFLPLDQAKGVDAIIIGGSHYSAYEDIPWIHKLTELIPKYVAAGVRVVGSCFGHQVMTNALGGFVGKNPSGRFVLKVETVRATPLLMACPKAAAALRLSSSGGCGGSGENSSSGGAQQAALRVVESHGDQALKLPAGAQLLLTSDTAVHEMWALGPNVLAFQFHPELPGTLAHEKIWSAVSANGRLSPQEAEASARSLLHDEVDAPAFLHFLNHFLNHGLDLPAAVDNSIGSGTAAIPNRACASGAAATNNACGNGIAACGAGGAPPQLPLPLRAAAAAAATAVACLALTLIAGGRGRREKVSVRV